MQAKMGSTGYLSTTKSVEEAIAGFSTFRLLLTKVVHGRFKREDLLVGPAQRRSYNVIMSDAILVEYTG